jgi:bifunctional non-homologous end joining protein LigD
MHTTTIESTQTDQITLYYRQGTSDKVYQIRIEPEGELFRVNFAYGRRGQTLNTGSKTPAPVYYTNARRIFDKLVQEKLAKGYTPGENGTPYQYTDREQRTTGILPQLLNPVDEQQASTLVTDDDWCMQEKKDGRRLLLKKEGETLIGINRKGLAAALPITVVQSANQLTEDFILDGECVGDVLYAFDLLRRGEESLLVQPYRTRLNQLIDLLDYAIHPHIQLIETAFEQTDKVALLQSLQQGKREGVVFKRLDASYTPGRPSSGGTQRKHKFYATLSAVVAQINEQRSIALSLFNGTTWVSAGNVTVPSNERIPVPGAVIEVRYLYAFPESRALYQPVYLKLRHDLAPMECVVSQLKYKPSEEDEA